jgi:hypothetical protein
MKNDGKKMPVLLKRYGAGNLFHHQLINITPSPRFARLE